MVPVVYMQSENEESGDEGSVFIMERWNEDQLINLASYSLKLSGVKLELSRSGGWIWMEQVKGLTFDIHLNLA